MSEEVDLVAAARVSPVAWALLTGEGAWEVWPHTAVMARQVQRLIADELDGLVISVPVRHGKTRFCAQSLAGWWVGAHPTDRVIMTSYAERQIKEVSKAARDDFAAWAPQVFGLSTWRRSSPALWEVYRDGERTGGKVYAIGAGGSLAGKGADLIVADDLIRNLQEARNASIMDGVWTWFWGDLMSRRQPGCKTLLINSRYAHNDVVGRLQDLQKRGELAGRWAFVCMPALCDDPATDPLDRELGEALWPEQYSREWLEDTRQNAGSHVFSALYQGKPSAEDGALFQRSWSSYYKTHPSGYELPDGTIVHADKLAKFSTCDLATSTKTSADWTALVTVGIDRLSGAMLVLDVERFRAEGPDLVPRIRAHLQANTSPVVFAERIGFQTSLIQQARREGLPIREVRPDGDKVSRALPATAGMEGGRVYFPTNAPWLADFQSELLTFPSGRHDDQVDAFSYAVIVGNQLGKRAESTQPRRYERRHGPRQPLRIGRY